MSEHNLAGLIFKTNLEKHPEVFTINENTVKSCEETARKVRAAHDEANPPKPVSAWEEYRQLRGTLHKLQQAAEGTAIYASNIAGNVALIEKNIKDAEHSRGNAFTIGNLVGERTYENRITRMKDELADAQKELRRAKKNKEHAAAALAAFDKHDRIAELQRHFDSLTNI